MVGRSDATKMTGVGHVISKHGNYGKNMKQSLAYSPEGISDMILLEYIIYWSSKIEE